MSDLCNEDIERTLGEELAMPTSGIDIVYKFFVKKQELRKAFIFLMQVVYCDQTRPNP
jgi:hypothetical protein